ncbi:hypothetical protein MPSEU_000763700 [Mayamaea pseudoterrestris]|nr:hypothetical protein MPSEU_000763700 [Mayamaea pseudoterrestris]
MKNQRQESSASNSYLSRLLWLALSATALGSVCFLQRYNEAQSFIHQSANLLSLQGGAVRRAASVSLSYAASNSAVDTFMPFPYADSISCETIDTRVLDGTYSDPNNGKYNIRQVIDRPIFKMSMHNREYDHMRYDTIFTNGRYYEYKVKKRFDLILSKARSSATRSIVLDVGANIGYYTMLAAAHGHDVVSFEINPANLIRLCESLSINRFDHRVAIYQRGVSSVTDQPLRVVIPARNPGQARMEQHNATTTNGRKMYTTETTTITLDRFAHDHGWFDHLQQQSPPKVTIPLLKLDVEGHEPHIISGSKQLLCSGLVENVLLEFNRMQEPNSQTAISILLECGYVVVHHEHNVVTRKTRAETNAYLMEIHEWRQRTKQNIDLWFQLAEAGKSDERHQAVDSAVIAA